ncbi:MAG: response regulator transcription factor [Bifidobacteriaceae bacterium]|jgi:DNA-binding NarL/FixJ family response regulator|nr:response regulator transcription factor [Bifidobacteriaceae bacterium]MCI1914764.1 response regulator transcription factor [Bifidobacteriaceae bacterium]
MSDDDDSHPKIAIVDNDPLTLRTLTEAMPRIIKHGTVIWSALDGAAAVRQCSEPDKVPSILLVDISLNSMTGMDVCRAIRLVNGTLPILLITAFPLERYIRAACDAGAQGIVGKADVKTLRCAVCTLLKGGVWGSVDATHEGPMPSFEVPAIAFIRLRREYIEQSETHTVELSAHEARVLELCAQGLSLTSVAREFHVTPSTARTLAKRARQKLGATSLSQAVVLWMKSQERW